VIMMAGAAAVVEVVGVDVVVVVVDEVDVVVVDVEVVVDVVVGVDADVHATSPIARMISAIINRPPRRIFLFFTVSLRVISPGLAGTSQLRQPGFFFILLQLSATAS
jgi:hypothetical protein